MSSVIAKPIPTSEPWTIPSSTLSNSPRMKTNSSTSAAPFASSSITGAPTERACIPAASSPTRPCATSSKTPLKMTAIKVATSAPHRNAASSTCPGFRSYLSSTTIASAYSSAGIAAASALYCKASHVGASLATITAFSATTTTAASPISHIPQPRRHPRGAGAIAEQLRAGAAAVRITPPLGHSLAGSFRDRKAVDVTTQLEAKALVLDEGASPVAVAVDDLPTRDAYAQRGYEDTSSPYQPGAGERLVDAAVDLLHELAPHPVPTI